MQTWWGKPLNYLQPGSRSIHVYIQSFIQSTYHDYPRHSRQETFLRRYCLLFRRIRVWRWLQKASLGDYGLPVRWWRAWMGWRTCLCPLRKRGRSNSAAHTTGRRVLCAPVSLSCSAWLPAPSGVGGKAIGILDLMSFNAISIDMTPYGAWKDWMFYYTQAPDVVWGFSLGIFLSNKKQGLCSPCRSFELSWISYRS